MFPASFFSLVFILMYSFFVVSLLTYCIISLTLLLSHALPYCLGKHQDSLGITSFISYGTLDLSTLVIFVSYICIAQGGAQLVVGWILHIIIYHISHRTHALTLLTLNMINSQVSIGQVMIQVTDSLVIRLLSLVIMVVMISYMYVVLGQYMQIQRSISSVIQSSILPIQAIIYIYSSSYCYCSYWQVWQVTILIPIVIQPQSGIGIVIVLKHKISQIQFISLWSINVFTVDNLILFYISYEGVLIPMYYLIYYGSSNRKISASTYFIIYTLSGSLLILISILGQQIEHGTGYYDILQYDQGNNQIMWCTFFICFVVKQPIYGYHLWLIRAHVESPTAGSVLLAAIQLKLGSYGLIILTIPILPYDSAYLRPLIVVLSIISITYSTLAAFTQGDIKIIIAYSSIVHMGTATLGQWTANTLGYQSCIYSLISHGYISSGQFIQVGVQSDRLHTRSIRYIRGQVMVYPVLVTTLLLFTLANSGYPISSGFIGELLSLLSSLMCYGQIVQQASVSVVLVPAFMLYTLHRISYGALSPYLLSIQGDLSRLELNLLSPLLALLTTLGLAPNLLLLSLFIFIFDLCIHSLL